MARLTARPAARPAELDLPATRGGVPLPCRAPGVHPDDWHPVGRDLAADDEYAQALCAGCPVTVECLRYSLDTREPYGVWGGSARSPAPRCCGRAAPAGPRRWRDDAVG